MKKVSIGNTDGLRNNIKDLQHLIGKLIDKQAAHKGFSSAEEMLYELIEGFKMQITKKTRIHGSEIVLNSRVEKNGNIILDVDGDIITITPESPHGSQIIDFIHLLSDYSKTIS